VNGRPASVDAPVYLQVEPVFESYVRHGEDERRLQGARVKRMTLTRPDKPLGGSVLVKVVLRIPAGVFYPLRPEAVVVIPETLTELQTIEVVASDPHADPDAES
jgi:hypothetical protein